MIFPSKETIEMGFHSSQPPLRTLEAKSQQTATFVGEFIGDSPGFEAEERMQVMARAPWEW